MKRILLLLLLGMFFSNVPFVFSANNAILEKCSTRKIILKGKGNIKQEIARSIVAYPIDVYLDGKMLYVDILSKTFDLTVKVVNVNTEEVIYQGKIMDKSLSIDLSLETEGSYKIELLSESYELSGDFELY